MSERDDGGPAFPRAMSVTEINADPGAEGMSLRDWFAGRVLPSFVLSGLQIAQVEKKLGENILREAASASYEIADAMLKARQS